MRFILIDYFCDQIKDMSIRKDITIQSLAEEKDILISYLDKDIVIVDSIQKYVEFSSAHLSMNAIVLCTEGRIQAMINNQKLELHKNQIVIVPPNMMIADLMVSPDFNMKGMFLTNRILQSFLREKVSVWNDMMYIRHQYVIDIEENEMLLYSHNCDMLILTFAKESTSPYRTDIIQSLLKAAILAICGLLKQKADSTDKMMNIRTAENHFQRFLDLLNTSPVKHRSVESYADELCISPKHLTAITKKCSGKTANQWIKEQVLEEIRFYLKQTDLSIKQISNRLNFPNPSFFGKYVKEHLGMTPGKLRNS